jgi:hypothetical protein
LRCFGARLRRARPRARGSVTPQSTTFTRGLRSDPGSEPRSFFNVRRSRCSGRRSSWSTVGTRTTFHTSRSPVWKRSSIASSLRTSSPSDFARRGRRLTSMLAESTTWLSIRSTSRVGEARIHPGRSRCSCARPWSPASHTTSSRSRSPARGVSHLAPRWFRRRRRTPDVPRYRRPWPAHQSGIPRTRGLAPGWVVSPSFQSSIPHPKAQYRHGVAGPVYSARRVALVPRSLLSFLVWLNKVEGAYQQRLGFQSLHRI